MSKQTMDVQPGAALAGAHRPVRLLATGEGPYPGTLVTDGDAVRVLTNDASVVDWRFCGAEHVAGPVDIARSADGYDVLLPWCTMRVDAFLARREAAGSSLSSGEWTTLAASLLRGLREASECGEDELTGTWWLTTDGRPVLVPGSGDTGKADAAALLELAERHGAERGLRRIIDGMRDALAQGLTVSANRAERWESELCEYAAPRVLDLGVADLSPQGREDVAVTRPPVEVRRLRRRVRDRRSLGDPLRAGVDRIASVLARVGPLSRWVPARGSLPTHPSERVQAGGRVARGRMLLIGAAVAAIVLTAGMLWPDGGGGSQAAVELTGSGTASSVAPPRESSASPSTTAGSEHPAPRLTEPASAVPAPIEDEGSALSEGVGPTDAAQSLLKELEECANRPESPCAAVVAGAQIDVGSVLSASAAGEPVLLDDYGDIAVLRLGQPDAGEQILVIVRQDGKWLVRDAYDVADQPKEG